MPSSSSPPPPAYTPRPTTADDHDVGYTPVPPSPEVINQFAPSDDIPSGPPPAYTPRPTVLTNYNATMPVPPITY